jgi:ankyrin repeat protein
VTIAETLIKAGAEVDAVTEMYGGGSTPLGLVATSVHPQQAGVQIALLETLLHYGASVDGAPGGWQPLTAALANGRPEAAEFLANHGARLDLEGAAGVGWLDAVKKFFNDDGSLKANATKALMEAGFRWACEYGRTSVVKFLLQRGVDLGAQDRNGQTGLHWAAIGGHFETIQLLLERRAPLEVKNVYGGTVLDQACWAAVNTGPAIDFVPIVEMLIAAGANVDAAGYPTGNERIDAVLRRHR